MRVYPTLRPAKRRTVASDDFPRRPACERVGSRLTDARSRRSTDPLRGYCRITEHPRRDNVKLSARNQLTGTVAEIHRGEAIANVVIDVAGQRLVASITVEAVEELGLSTGSPVTAIIKASDVIVAAQ